MVFTNKYSKALTEKFLNFSKSKSLKDAFKLFGENNTLNENGVADGLTNYVVDELIALNCFITKEEIEIYNYIEECRKTFSTFKKGSDEDLMDNAYCVCFLEHLINIASWGRIQFERFVPYLGEKSKEYCRAWDEFTGVKSPGLWD